jgi:hypothetical protein
MWQKNQDQVESFTECGNVFGLCRFILCQVVTYVITTPHMVVLTTPTDSDACRHEPPQLTPSLCYKIPLCCKTPDESREKQDQRHTTREEHPHALEATVRRGCVARPFFNSSGIMSDAFVRLMNLRHTGH